MAATDEDDRLRRDIATLRFAIDAELDRDGGANRALLLACAQLLREKNDRVRESGWVE